MPDKYQYDVTIKVTSFGKGDEEFEDTGYSSSEQVFSVSAENDAEAEKLAQEHIGRMSAADGPTPPDGIYYVRKIISMTKGRLID